VRHELKTVDRVAWLIQRRHDANPAIKGPGPWYLMCYGHERVGSGGVPNFKFTDDAQEAMQFARQEDAQNLLDWFGSTDQVDRLDDRKYHGIGNRGCIVAEHIFEEAANAR
jgi:hypothetical protein